MVKNCVDPFFIESLNCKTGTLVFGGHANKVMIFDVVCLIQSVWDVVGIRILWVIMITVSVMISVFVCGI